MKLFLAAIILFIISGCKDNIVNHYIDVPVPAKHDTTYIYIDRDSTGHDDNDGEHDHHHHRKPHKDKGDD